MQPRFILRLPDGTDHPLDDVEALAREMEEGRVPPTSLLFDRGTGRWETAESAPLYRFLEEELARRREEEEGGAASGLGLDLDALDPPLDDSDTDPFGMELDLTPDPVADPAPPSDPEAAEPEPRPSFGSSPGPSSHEPRSEPREPDPPEPLALEPLGSEPLRPPPPPQKASFRSEPSPSSEPSPRSESSPHSESAGRGGVAGGSRADSSVERPRLTGSRRALLLLGLGVVSIAAAIAVSSFPAADGREAGSSGDAANGSTSTSGPEGLRYESHPILPEPLLERAWSLRSDVRDDLREHLGALRVERELEEGPPFEWLSGRYFSDAGAFGHVRDYWQRYGALVEEMRDSARPLFIAALEERVAPSDPEQAEEIRSYLVEEFDAGSAAREERFRALESVADAALDLHDLLVERTEEIAYVPALGPGISPEPVLEARMGDPLLQREVEVLLDRILAHMAQAAGAERITRAHVLAALFEDLVPR